MALYSASREEGGEDGGNSMFFSVVELNVCKGSLEIIFKIKKKIFETKKTKIKHRKSSF